MGSGTGSGRRRRFVAAAVAALAAAPLHAQANPADAPGAVPATPPAAATAPGGSTRGPFSFTGAETADVIGDAAGGLARGVKFLSKTAVSATYDGAQDGHEGLTALASAQYVAGGHISGANAGDLQTLDNIEAFGAVRIYEAWLARDYDNRRGWKAGLVDLNVDFDTQEVAALFLNSSDGIGPDLSKSGLNGPSIYPTAALGVTAYFRPNPNLTLRAGLFDGTAGSPDHPGAFAVRLSAHDGAFFILQADRRFGSGLRVEGGGWAYTAGFDAVNRVDAAGDPLRFRRGRGIYALIEGPIVKRGDDRGLSGWLRAGTADPVVERVAGYVGGGLVYTGPLAARAQDQAGIAVNHAMIVPVGRPNAPQTTETAIELTYRFIASASFAVQPDAQYIVRPGGGGVPDALVLGVRFTLTLTRPSPAPAAVP